MTARDITLEFVNMAAPEHTRTSCSDERRDNGFYEIMESKIRGVVVKRVFKTTPRCNRCVLLDMMRRSCLDSLIEIKVSVEIMPKQPDFEITQK